MIDLSVEAKLQSKTMWALSTKRTIKLIKMIKFMSVVLPTHKDLSKCHIQNYKPETEQLLPMLKTKGRSQLIPPTCPTCNLQYTWFVSKKICHIILSSKSFFHLNLFFLESKFTMVCSFKSIGGLQYPGSALTQDDQNECLGYRSIEDIKFFIYIIYEV